MSALKKRQILNLAMLGLFVIMVVTEIITVINILRLDMLPALYTVLIILVFVLIAGGIGVLLFVKNRKLRGKKVRAAVRNRRIIATVCMVLVLVICIVVSIVIGDVLKTIDAVSQDEPDKVTRTVYVRADDPAQELAAADSYIFGYVKTYDTECTQQAVAELQKVFGSVPATASFDKVSEMVDALLNSQIDAMIMNSGYVSLLEYEEGYEDFTEKTRVLADVQIPGQTAGANGSQPAGENSAGTGEKPNGNGPVNAADPFIVYLSGSDDTNGILSNSRSDVNILAVVNPTTRQVLLVNTPRDYYIPNPACSNQMDKLTHCGIWGLSNSMEALGAIYNEKVDYYLQINFEGFKKVIDALGGITVHSDYAFVAITRTRIVKGENRLNGQQALDFARERYTLAGGDMERGKNQMKVIKAVIAKATSGTTVINNYSAIMASLEGMFRMDIPTTLIQQLVKAQLADMSGWEVFSYSAKGTGIMAETCSTPGLKLSCIEPDEASVKKATELIDKVIAGEKLTDADV